MIEPGGDLWDTACRLYALPGVAEICLALQDGFAADVDLLLAAVWLGRRGARPDPRDIAEARAAARRWQELAVRPLRRLRHDLKGLPVFDVAGSGDFQDELRESVRRLELSAERIELEALGRILMRRANPADIGLETASSALDALAELPASAAATAAELLGKCLAK